MNKLAIIIPAYKADFFREALTSIANQTSMNFHLYIGNDNSPENIDDIVNEFKDKIDLTYVKFEENLGGKDLVAQWERCINISQGEEWIWLFSDDDIMEPNCVEEFYKNVSSNNSPFLYHFNISIINSSGIQTELARAFPPKLSASDFLYGKMSSKYKSYVVEYIFSRKSYESFNGFPKFDLAWNTDDAMWYQMAEHSLIKTLGGAKVHWRASGINISRIKNSTDITKRKLQADLSYLIWLEPKINGLDDRNKRKLRRLLIFWFYVRVINSKKVLDRSFIDGVKLEFNHMFCPGRMVFLLEMAAMIKMSKPYRTVVKLKQDIIRHRIQSN